MDLRLAVDKAIGGGTDRLVQSHHARRLRKIGWERALHPPDSSLWAGGDPAPRSGCSLEVLIDGAVALPRLAEELERAESHVHLAGWFVSPDFALVRRPEHLELRTLLARLAEKVRVRVLLWAGSPLPLFHPDRRDVNEALRALTGGTRIEAAADANERPLHCHHEKSVVIDDRVAFVGGIDLTTYAGDRFDVPGHPARDGVAWHDALCVLRGPAVHDVAAHFQQRWRAVTGESPPAPRPQPAEGDVEVQVVRTVPERVYRAIPRGDFRSEIARILRDKLEHPPTDEFRLVLLLPAKPNDGADDTRGELGELVDADAGRGRLMACAIYALGDARPKPVYVHAKIGIVDDRWLTIGSANLNEHSLFSDTELNVVACNERLARELRLRLWAEHLQRSADDVAGDSTRVVDEQWKPVAEEQARRRSHGLPVTQRVCLLPQVSRKSRRLLGPLNGLLVDG